MKIIQVCRKILGLENINEFSEKDKRKLVDLEISVDDLQDNYSDVEGRVDDLDSKIDDLDSRIDDLERKDILDYDSYDFARSDDFEDLAEVVNKLEKAIRVIALKTDTEFKVDSVLSGKENE